MLEIEYKGATSIIVSTKDDSLWIDPLSNPISYKEGKNSPVLLGTELRFLPEKQVSSLKLEGPGEYETGSFRIRGVAALRHIDSEGDTKNTTIYRVETGEFRLAVLGHITPVLDEDQLEALGMVDILILPVGGNGYTLDATSAVKIVRQIEPKVVIPVHFSARGINYEVPQDSVDTFIHELGSPVETVSKLKIKTSSALPQTLTVYKFD